jgi:hypothetical protein
MYFAAEHLMSKLQISEAQLRDFEARGIVLGITKGKDVLLLARLVPTEWNSVFHAHARLLRRAGG